MLNIAPWIITGGLATAFGAGALSQMPLTRERYRAFAGSPRPVTDRGCDSSYLVKR